MRPYDVRTDIADLQPTNEWKLKKISSVVQATQAVAKRRKGLIMCVTPPLDTYKASLLRQESSTAKRDSPCHWRTDGPKLASLIDEVLTNGIYRKNAQDMKRAIAKTNGLEKAVDLLEEAFQAIEGNFRAVDPTKKPGDF
jgi:hypothetical protein